MTRLGYVQFTLFLVMLVAFMSSPAAVDFPPHGDVMSVRALRDGTALVAWRGDADYITHVRSDGTVISAELVPRRLEILPFRDLDANEAVPAATYHGKPVVLHDESISIGGVEHALPHVFVHDTDLVPARLQPLAGELPQLVGLETSDGPIVYDLETAAIVWHGDPESVILVVRDGAHIYTVGWGKISVFDPLLFKMTTIVESDGSVDHIGGGHVWTYDHHTHRIDEPVVHAISSPAMITALR